MGEGLKKAFAAAKATRTRDVPTLNLVVFPVPIRPDVVAQVWVPHNLTKEEAEKITRVVMALAQPGNGGENQ